MILPWRRLVGQRPLPLSHLVPAFVPALVLAACASAPPPAPPPAPPAQPHLPASAVPPSPPAPAAVRGPERQREADTYTRYELLAPGAGRFRILYEVTATDPGATEYFNPIRKGSVVSDEAVYDRASGKPLGFDVVSGEQARSGGLPDADPTMSYLRVHLPRPVPAEGGVRLLIDKTYTDLPSYSAEGSDALVFRRPLGIRRNAIVLPPGYEIVSCNLPVQVVQEQDGRLALSFVHFGPDAAPLEIRARKVSLAPLAPKVETAPAPRSAEAAPAGGRAPSRDERLSERAHQDREIVYFLQAPETHAFRLYHDYTESRLGTDRYLNVVRTGSTVASPSARNLDTGEALKVDTVRGADLPKGEGNEGAPSDAQVVIVQFPAIAQGTSMRLRITETYTDPASYRLEGGALIFDRTFGRPRNSVVLPAGWSLTATSIPAQIRPTADGLTRLDFVNPRNDEIAVLIEARPRG